MAVAAEQYVAIDNIPELAEERTRVRGAAWMLLRSREEQERLGETELPLAIDALSTADHVLEARTIYGLDSPEYQNLHAGLKLDCLRLVAEWYRKKRPEYFAPSRHFFDAESGEFYSHGLSIRQMTENALRPIVASPEEEARRVNERVEDETPRILRKLGNYALAGCGIRTISECTDKAVADYQEDMKHGAKHRGYDGYVPEIEKIMIRDMHLDSETGDRIQEQLGLPGIYINHWVIQEALRRCGVETKGLGKTELHGMQLAVGDDLMEFVALLDDIASDEWRTNIFMGEEVPEGYVKDYENFRIQALARQESLADTAGTVANFVLDLAEDGFDRRKAPAHVEDFVKKLLLHMAKEDMTVAEQMFDEKTAVGLYQVAQLERQGLHEEAYELMREVEANAPGGGACNGGSCGLESLNIYSKEGKELKEKLKAKDGDTLVKDKERSCKCGSKSIVYAYNKREVKKYCESCHAFESKRTGK